MAQETSPVVKFGVDGYGEYVPLRRACDDAHENFLEIRDKRLWIEHEFRQKQQTQPEMTNGTAQR